MVDSKAEPKDNRKVDSMVAQWAVQKEWTTADLRVSSKVVARVETTAETKASRKVAMMDT